MHLLSAEQKEEFERLSSNVSARWKDAIHKLQQLESMSPQTLAEDEMQKLIEATREAITSAMMSGFEGHVIEPKLQHELSEDVYYFSGFKTYASLKEASTLLRDEHGQTKSFDRFYRDVAKLDATYNRNYLQAEYLYATASAESAARWTEQMQDADDYDLQYRTAGDSRVREEHRALDLVTLPAKHAFWETYYPPNGWRCRCTVIQVRKGKYPTTADAVALEAGQAAISDKNKIFRGNPAREGAVFPKNHPYYGQRGYGHCTVASIDLSATDDNEVCKVYRTLQQTLNDNDTKTLRETDQIIKKWAKKKGGIIAAQTLKSGYLSLRHDAVKRYLGHAKDQDAKRLLAVIAEQPERLNFVRFDALGNNKDMTNAVDAKNVKQKAKRKVIGYNVYDIADERGNAYRVGLEVVKRSDKLIEQPYYVKKKKRKK